MDEEWDLVNSTDYGPEVHYEEPSRILSILTVIITFGSIIADVFIIYVIAKFKDLQTISNRRKKMDEEWDLVNSTDYGPEIHHEEHSRILSISTVIITIGSIIADFFIIYVIAKFKELQTIPNWYLLNWMICNVLYLVLSPIVFTIIIDNISVSMETGCIWFGEILVTFTGNLLFIILLIIDWYILQLSGSSFFVKFRSYYKIQIGLIWSIVAISSVCVCFHCILKTEHYWAYGIRMTYTTFIIFILLLRIIKKKTCNFTSEKHNLILILVLSNFFCLLPVTVIIVIYIFYNQLAHPNIAILAELIEYSNSIILIIILYCCDVGFRNGFRRLWYNRETDNSHSSFENIDLKSAEMGSLNK